jgi:MFS family permease
MPNMELTLASLGVTESGLFPGVVYYLSMWYKRDERQYRISLFFSCASLAGAFGGIWGIAHMRNVGGYAGWRWIFILVRTSIFIETSLTPSKGRTPHYHRRYRCVLVHLKLSSYGDVALKRGACPCASTSPC